MKSILKTAICVILIILFAATVLIMAVVGTKRNEPQNQVSGTSLPTVIIDAGHGGEDGGASGADGTLEKDLNLDIANKLCEMLKEAGVNVIMTRTEDIMLYDRSADYQGHKKTLDLKARLKICEDNPGALFVSIHMNAFPQKKYDGLQVYFPLGDAESERLAGIIQTDVAVSLQPQNLRKPKGAGSNIFLLYRNPNTAVLIECGFLSNDAECARLNDNEYRKSLSRVICESLLKYLAQGGEKP